MWILTICQPTKSLWSIPHSARWCIEAILQKEGCFWEQKMSKSAKAKVDKQFTIESHQLQGWNIQKIRAAMEVQMYSVKLITTTKQKQLPVHTNRARQMATQWSDADRQRATEWLEGKIHQMTPVRSNLFYELIPPHERQLLQDVGMKATSPRSTFAEKLAQMKTAAGDEVYRAGNMTPDKRFEFQVRLSDDETEATTWSISDTDCIGYQLEKEIYGITSKEPMRFKKEFFTLFIEFEACYNRIGVQVLRKSIKQCVLHFGYAKMHLVGHISEWIWQLGSADNFATTMSE